MKTNELKKGTRVLLRNGWEAQLADNMKGNTRLTTVFGDYTEMGSVYSHDIVGYDLGAGPPCGKGGWLTPATWEHVEHTPKQIELRKMVSTLY